ncbi:MAG: prephenate dehydratase domain-containing protein, partial [Jiangellales bacterium]
MRYAYLGPPGTFTEAALRSMPLAETDETTPFTTVSAALDAVREGIVDGAVVPMENSVEGSVNATLDELAVGVRLVIAHEVVLPVAFDLVAPAGVELGDIRRVATHPHAEAQCRVW